jgi:hypothetical protein
LRGFCAALFLVSALGTACGSGAEPRERELEIRLDAPDENAQPAAVRVLGIPSEYLAAFGGLSPQEWASALRVTVAGDNAADDPAMPAVAGSFRVVDRSIVFTPQFGFDPGRRYRVVFDASHLPATRDRWRPDPVVAVVGLPGKELAPSTVVAQVYPTAALVPENQLRLYIHFSAPMGLKGGIGHVRLFDEAGPEVEDPFLPLDAEFWNRDRTRFTVFFDPGRQKRGILPNEEMGRSLIAGRSYTLVISREWRDAQGLPLKQEFRRAFKAGPPDERPLDQKTWRVEAPRAGTRDPLSVMFPEPLDHGLLLRALGVADAVGSPVEGERRVESGEKRWTFTPGEPWRPGEYFLMALTILEDMAGNRIGRAFEVDTFDRANESAELETVSVPFQITISASR